jgi:murein DD-endopeptidase MepM/ murein hydrolase activator NlpD
VQPPAAVPTPAPTPADAQISELGRGRFVWPLQGAVVSDFGPKGPGQRNDGINIGASLGASVRAAAAGDVVYAGDQVPGFGNLVLIKHADGWVTAYGHLSRVMVKMQQKVVQGQEIGQAGSTGGVSEPQLHFEVRYAPSPLERAKPVDPRLVLPK